MADSYLTHHLPRLLDEAGADVPTAVVETLREHLEDREVILLQVDISTSPALTFIEGSIRVLAVCRDALALFTFQRRSGGKNAVLVAFMMTTGGLSSLELIKSSTRLHAYNEVGPVLWSYQGMASGSGWGALELGSSADLDRKNSDYFSRFALTGPVPLARAVNRY